MRGKVPRTVLYGTSKFNCGLIEFFKVKPWAVLILHRIPAAKMMNFVLQLNVMLFLLYLRVSNLGQQVAVRARGQLGAGQGSAEDGIWL